MEKEEEWGITRNEGRIGIFIQLEQSLLVYILWAKTQSR